MLEAGFEPRYPPRYHDDLGLNAGGGHACSLKLFAFVSYSRIAKGLPAPVSLMFLSIHALLPLFTHTGHLGVVRAFWNNRQHLDTFLKLMLREEKKKKSFCR